MIELDLNRLNSNIQNTETENDSMDFECFSILLSKLNGINEEDFNPKIFDPNKIDQIIRELTAINTLKRLNSIDGIDDKIIHIFDYIENTEAQSKHSTKLRSIIDGMKSNYSFDYFSSMLKGK